MKLLLDSNVLLWSLYDPDRLTAKVADLIEDDHNSILVSYVSFWELAIKIALGKLPIAGSSIQPIMDRTAEIGADLLPLRPEHIVRTSALPHHHRDPFDRMLIAQALTESVPLLTSDKKLAAYEAEIIW